MPSSLKVCSPSSCVTISISIEVVVFVLDVVLQGAFVLLVVVDDAAVATAFLVTAFKTDALVLGANAVGFKKLGGQLDGLLYRLGT